MSPQFLPWLVAGLSGLLLAVACVLWIVKRPRTPQAPPPLPDHWDLQPRPVFSADERKVYRQLREALPHHVILAKLPLVRLCQPIDPATVQQWYKLLGNAHVTFAICSANGRVLAAMDLSYDHGSLPSRSTRIKQAVLAACRVRYLRCPLDHLPSIPELQLLVPQNTAAARGPEPAPSEPAPLMPQPEVSGLPPSRRRERTTLWQDSSAFSDSFPSQATGESEPGRWSNEPVPGVRPAMVGHAFPKRPPTRH